MIGVFPRLLPDELFYSAIARYQWMLGLPSTIALRGELFDNKSSTAATTDLPSRLRFFVSRLPQPAALTDTDLLMGHTTYPYYAPFVTETRRRVARTGILTGNNPRQHANLGARRSVASPRGRLDGKGAKGQRVVRG